MQAAEHIGGAVLRLRQPVLNGGQGGSIVRTMSSVSSCWLAARPRAR
jgi:hypothetical protein